MIPAEAVEVAAKALAESIGNAVGIFEMHSWATQDKYREHARAALEAAAPHIQSGAWQAGWGAGWDDAREDWGKTPNPYIK